MISFLNRHKPPSLGMKILAAEQRVSCRKRQIGIHSATLTQKIAQGLTTTPNLLLASGMGCIIGEVTKQPTTTDGNGNNRPATQTTPLKTVLTLLSSIQALYAALPLVLVIKSAYETKAAKRMPKPGLRESACAATSIHSPLP